MQSKDTPWQAGRSRELGNGLRLRWSHAEDADAIAQLVGTTFRANTEAPFRQYLANWVYELCSGESPLMGPEDFVLVEDIQTGQVVASTCYWHHTWHYEGIPLRVGRPEIVATATEYRQRGLVRALFQELHARSQAAGDLVQAITGIGYFYRQFDYEYALPLSGGRTVSLDAIPALATGRSEPYLLRDATPEHIPVLQSLYQTSIQGQMIVAQLDEAWWRYQLTHWQNSRMGEHWHTRLIVDRADKVWGYVATPVTRMQANLHLWGLAFTPTTNLVALLPSLLRTLRADASNTSTASDAGELSGIYFNTPPQSAIFTVLDKLYSTQPVRPYAWYIRVADLAGFLHHITPVLEQRLSTSLIAGYSGDLKLDFYRSGLRLVFEQGRLTSIANWTRSAWPGVADASFPPLVFLQLLFGYRTLEELIYSFPDVETKDEAALLLNVLFPHRPSNIMALG